MYLKVLKNWQKGSNMQSCENFIKKNNLLKSGEIIGVGCSGGSDSMALLHYLATNQEKFDIEVVAIHIDHQIRENSYIDADFVKERARELGVRYYKFRVDVPKIAKEKNQSLETAARNARYGVFKSLYKKGLIDKIALAHHTRDQAETILMHLFRGCGNVGAMGMSPVSDKIYIRPFLNTTKDEIFQYLNENRLDYCEDITNEDNSYNRNFVRNVIMKDILSRWPGAESAIVNFAQAIREDDEYINKQINADAIITEDKIVKIPTSYFLFDNAVVSRILFKAVKSIGLTQDIERKHIDAIKNLALNGENGKRISLPFEAVAVKEYDYLTIVNRHEDKPEFSAPFKCGEFALPDGRKLIVKRVKIDFVPSEGQLLLDYRKVPKDAEWRFRADGDTFTKFGGGSKKLKSFFIDKKIPLRMRDSIPVLASGSEIYAVAGIEISDKVKVENAPSAYMIEIK